MAFLLLALEGNVLLLEEVNSCYSSKELLSLWLKQKELGPIKLNLERGALKIETKIQRVLDISTFNSSVK